MPKLPTTQKEKGQLSANQYAEAYTRFYARYGKNPELVRTVDDLLAKYAAWNMQVAMGAVIDTLTDTDYSQRRMTIHAKAPVIRMAPKGAESPCR